MKLDKLKAEYENEISKLNNMMITLNDIIASNEDELKMVPESLNNVLSSKKLELETLTKENRDLKTKIKKS